MKSSILLLNCSLSEKSKLSSNDYMYNTFYFTRYINFQAAKIKVLIKYKKNTYNFNYCQCINLIYFIHYQNNIQVNKKKKYNILV